MRSNYAVAEVVGVVGGITSTLSSNLLGNYREHSGVRLSPGVTTQQGN